LGFARGEWQSARTGFARMAQELVGHMVILGVAGNILESPG